MAQGSTGQGGADQGSMTLFWAVIGLAAALFVIYLIVGLKHRPPQPLAPGEVGKLRGSESRDPVPDVQLKSLTGNISLSPADLKGKVVVLHLWATWCPPCRSEFPDFTRYAAETREGVVVMAVALDKEPAAVSVYVGNMPHQPPIYVDPQGKLPGQLGTSGIPETILVDKSGKIAFRASGAQDWSADGVPRLVETLRAES